MSTYRILEGDCLERLKTLPDNSVDSIVTDPPYGLSKEPDMAKVLRHWLAGDDYQHKGGGFMGKSWDSFVPGPSVWRECLRVLKPGGHLLAFFGSRTYDLGALAVRLAGFEIRDQVMWLYGSGFPKSQNVSKAIDKAAGAERQVLAQGKAVKRMIPGADQNSTGSWIKDNGREYVPTETAPATATARQWDGWGTALKPAHEPILVARKPLTGTVAVNVLAHGTGALNIDGCRVEYQDEIDMDRARVPNPIQHNDARGVYQAGAGKGRNGEMFDPSKGRWPANLIHDGSDEVLAAFPEAPGQQRASNDSQRSQANTYGAVTDNGKEYSPRGDKGSAARFFYCAKASKTDRTERGAVENRHPTVKPTDLMRYLCRLVTPPGGTVLDPFTGSGSTGKAAILEGFEFVGIEKEAEYLPIARARIEHAGGVDADESLDDFDLELDLDDFDLDMDLAG